MTPELPANLPEESVGERAPAFVLHRGRQLEAPAQNLGQLAGTRPSLAQVCEQAQQAAFENGGGDGGVQGPNSLVLIDGDHAVPS